MDLNLGWMAWTWQTAAFFGAVAASLLLMTLWEFARPGGGPRDGVLGLRTTRGDRLFISLLLAAYVHLGWLAWAPDTLPLWYASVAAGVLAVAIFLFV